MKGKFLIRKLIVSLALVFVVAFGNSSAFAATNATLDNPAFSNLINNVIQVNDSPHIDVTTTNWMLLYSISLEDNFDNAFPQVYIVANVISKNGKKYMSISTSNEAQWRSNFHCITFIKTVCHNLDKGTSLWIRGANFETLRNSGNLPTARTILGTFGSDARYNGRHALVYWGPSFFWKSLCDRPKLEGPIGLHSPSPYHVRLKFEGLLCSPVLIFSLVAEVSLKRETSSFLH